MLSFHERQNACDLCKQGFPHIGFRAGSVPCRGLARASFLGLLWPVQPQKAFCSYTSISRFFFSSKVKLAITAEVFTDGSLQNENWKTFSYIVMGFFLIFFLKTDPIWNYLQGWSGQFGNKFRNEKVNWLFRTHPESLQGRLRIESRFCFVFSPMFFSVSWSLFHAASPHQTIIKPPIEMQITFPV